MRNYIRTLLTGILGLIGGSIGYFSEIPLIIKLLITMIALIFIAGIALYDRKKQLENDRIELTFQMKHHLNNDYVTNHSDSEKPMEAQRLDRYFKRANKIMRHEVIADILKVSVEEVEEMLQEKIPEHLIDTDAFKITNR